MVLLATSYRLWLESDKREYFRTYLETVASLPWSLESSEAVIDLDRAREVLERDHFGMTKVVTVVSPSLVIKDYCSESLE